MTEHFEECEMHFHFFSLCLGERSTRKFESRSCPLSGPIRETTGCSWSVVSLISLAFIFLKDFDVMLTISYCKCRLRRITLPGEKRK